MHTKTERNQTNHRSGGCLRTIAEHAGVLVHAAPPRCGPVVRHGITQGLAFVHTSTVTPRGVALEAHTDWTLTVAGQHAWVSKHDRRFTRGLALARGRYRAHTDARAYPSALWLENLAANADVAPAGIAVSAPDGAWRVEVHGNYAGETRTMDHVIGARAGIEFLVMPGAHIVCEAPEHGQWTVRGRDDHTWFEIVRTTALGLVAVRYPDDRGDDGGPRIAATKGST